MQPSRDLDGLVAIMAALRDPQTGCPWDIVQDFASIRHYTIEEAYEVADAIERSDFVALREELGDLILQPVYHAQMAAEAGLFDIADVIETVTQKLIRRHPHVFGTNREADAEAAQGRWEAIKAEERRKKAENQGPDAPLPSLLDDVPAPLPALARAQKLTKRAASIGFDWPDIPAVIAKVREEFDEVQAAETQEEKQEEVGDLLFAVANLARKLGVDPEAALRDANLKFTRRFHYVESRCREDSVAPAEAGLDRLDGYWNEIRAKDKKRD